MLIRIRLFISSSVNLFTSWSNCQLLSHRISCISFYHCTTSVNWLIYLCILPFLVLEVFESLIHSFILLWSLLRSRLVEDSRHQRRGVEKAIVLVQTDRIRRRDHGRYSRLGSSAVGRCWMVETRRQTVGDSCRLQRARRRVGDAQSSILQKQSTNSSRRIVQQVRVPSTRCRWRFSMVSFPLHFTINSSFFRKTESENIPSQSNPKANCLSKVDLDSKVFLGQSVAQSFAWTCSALSIMHVSNFKVLAQILYGHLFKPY